MDTIEHYFHIDSGQRDTEAFPTRSHFKIKLESPLFDVVSFEVLGLIVPNVGDLIDLPYLIIDIYELNNTFAGARVPISCCAIVNPQHPVTGPGGTSYVHTCRKIAERSPMVYRPPRARIYNLTISIRRPDGSLYDFGTDAADTCDITKQFMLSFKVAVKNKDASGLLTDFRAVR